MIIDLLFFVLMMLAVAKGFRKGLVIAVFSFLALFIGLAAAMKLSVVVAEWLGNQTNINQRWLPFISFALVMIIVSLLIRWCGMLIERSLQLVMLGFANKLGGIIFYALIYTLIFSIVLFYAEKLHLLKPETIAASGTYRFIAPLGPKAINAFGVIIPAFKNMFLQLEDFFDHVAHNVNTAYIL